MKHDWIKPGWKWVDPEKELNADLAAVDAGVMTYSEIAEKQGKDFLKLLETRKMEIAAKEAAGLPEIRSKLTREPMMQQQQEPAPEPEPSDNDLGDDEVEALQRPDSFSPPQGVRSAAARGLKLREKYGRGGTAVGVARARDLSNGKAVSFETIQRMHSFFERHGAQGAGNAPKAGEEPDAGYIAWLLWGGNAGRSWARSIRNKYTKD